MKVMERSKTFSRTKEINVTRQLNLIQDSAMDC
jgi:hypothetical protein